MTTALASKIDSMTADELRKALETLLADRKVKAKVTKPPKVTTVESALPKLEHCNESYDGIEIPPSDYRPLQHWLKERGIKASGSTAVLRERAALYLSGKPVDMAKVSAPKREKKSKTQPRKEYGLSYRKAQKLVSWFKANMPKAVLPELVKNIGWDNVSANLDSLLRTDWFRNLSEKQLRSMAQDIFLTDDEFTAFLNEV